MYYLFLNFLFCFTINANNIKFSLNNAFKGPIYYPIIIIKIDIVAV